MQSRRKHHRTAHLTMASFLFSLAACATPGPPESLVEIFEHHAVKLQKQCLSYYFWREPKIVYPDPVQICRRVYTVAARGGHVRNWRM